MTMKKSLIAMAVAGVTSAPMAAQAAPELYGEFGLQLQSSSIDQTGNQNPGYFFNESPDDAGVSMFDGWESRFGLRGSEDIGNGLSASYRVELGTNFNGINNEGSNIDIRLGWVALSGDFGKVKAGTYWSTLYEYSGWNIWRTPSNGSYIYNYLTGTFSTGQFAGVGVRNPNSGLRADNSIQYTYGGGGYSSDPFTFSVGLEFDDKGQVTDGSGGTTQDDETLDSVTIGAQGTFGNATINGVVLSENRTSGQNELTWYSLGGRYDFGKAMIRGSYMVADFDTANGAEPSGFQIVGDYDFGSGWSVTGSVGAADADDFNLRAFNGSSGVDIDSNLFFQVKKDLSNRTYLYADVDNVEFSDDDSETVFTLGTQHSF